MEAGETKAFYQKPRWLLASIHALLLVFRKRAPLKTVRIGCKVSTSSLAKLVAGDLL